MSMRFLLTGYDAAIFAVLSCCVISVRGSIFSRGVRWLVAGLVSALIGVTVLALQPQWPGALAVAVGACFLFGYFALIHQAIADIFDSSLRFFRLSLAIALLVGVLCYWYAGRPSGLLIGVGIFSAAVILQAGGSAMILFTQGIEALQYPLWTVGSLFALLVVCLLAILPAVATASGNHAAIGGLQAFLVLSFCFLSLALAGSVLWLGWAVQQRNIEILANTDVLTGLWNRRAFDHILNEELANPDLQPDSICLVLVDLDAFHQVNESHGKLIGDEVIRQIGRLLKACTRSTDDVARYGGEEYVMILRHINRPRAESAAERLRAAISSIQGLPEKIQVTASFGVAMNKEGENLHSLFARSEEALQLSKRSGRNMVRVHSGSLKPSLVYTENS